jgi:glycosyltransferase involved in cell wall biosynthesis
VEVYLKTFMIGNRSRKKKISVVLPLYNEEDNVFPLVEKIKSLFPKKYALEFILIDDGSTDKTREKVRLLTKSKNVKAIFLYHNFGHQIALSVGLASVEAQAAIALDADFQHPPELIPAMISLWEGGYDLVVAQKKEDPSAPLGLKVFRLLGYNLYRLFGEKYLLPGVSDFYLMDKSVLAYVKKCSEKRLVLRALVVSAAKNMSIIPYRVAKRKEGVSGYSFMKRLNFFSNSIIFFSLVPLRLASLIGLVLMFCSFAYLIFVLITKFIVGKQIVQGWTALVSLLIILFGFLFFYLGILGEYLGAIFDEVKNRPRFWVEETINMNQKDFENEMRGL